MSILSDPVIKWVKKWCMQHTIHYLPLPRCLGSILPAGLPLSFKMIFFPLKCLEVFWEIRQSSWSARYFYLKESMLSLRQKIAYNTVGHAVSAHKLRSFLISCLLIQSGSVYPWRLYCKSENSQLDWFIRKNKNVRFFLCSFLFGNLILLWNLPGV